MSTEIDTARLAELEQVIDRGMQSFLDVGNALVEIRDEKLYRKSHKTFEAYCKERWQISRTRGYELISAATVVTKMSAIADKNTPSSHPINESQARELAKVPAEKQAEVWETATATAPDGKVTARHIRETAESISERGKPGGGGSTTSSSKSTPATSGPASDEAADELPCRLVRYNPRRRARGAEAAEVEIDGEILWMSPNDIDLNIREFGPLQGLLDAKAAYASNTEFPGEDADSGTEPQETDPRPPRSGKEKPGVVLDAIDRPVPPELTEQHAAAASILSAATKLDAVKQAVEKLSGEPGGEFLSRAKLIEEIQAIKGAIAQARYWSECPRCQGQVGQKCAKCGGAGFLPFAKRGTLSADDKLYLGVD